VITRVFFKKEKNHKKKNLFTNNVYLNVWLSTYLITFNQQKRTLTPRLILPILSKFFKKTPTPSFYVKKIPKNLFVKNFKNFYKSSKPQESLSTFKLYMQVNYTSNFLSNKTHSSFKSNFFSFNKKGLLVINISKIFQKWKVLYNLLFNIYFYKIKILTFGTSFFKKEVQSLNWDTSKKMKFMWRYTNIFFFFTQNKLEVIGGILFTHFKLSGYNTALVFDIIYHKYTLNYLNKLNYYTIGVVATTSNSKFVDVAIPVSSDNLFSQLFFLRTTLKIRQKALTSLYNNYRSYILKL
jgi:hypothetical protein